MIRLGFTLLTSTRRTNQDALSMLLSYCITVWQYAECEDISTVTWALTSKEWNLIAPAKILPKTKNQLTIPVQFLPLNSILQVAHSIATILLVCRFCFVITNDQHLRISVPRFLIISYQASSIPVRLRWTDVVSYWIWKNGFLFSSWTYIIFFTRGWRALFLVNNKPWPHIPELPHAHFWIIFFVLTSSNLVFMNSEIFVLELQHIVLKNSALVFLTFEAINSWALSIRILTLHS